MFALIQHFGLDLSNNVKIGITLIFIVGGFALWAINNASNNTSNITDKIVLVPMVNALLLVSLAPLLISLGQLSTSPDGKFQCEMKITQEASQEDEWKATLADNVNSSKSTTYNCQKNR